MPGGQLPQRHGAGRRLGSRAGRPLPHRLDDPKIQFGLPEVTLGLMPGAARHHQDDAPARPDGRAALPRRRQAVRARARRRSSAWCRSWSPDAEAPSHGGAGLDRTPTRAPQQPWDDKNYRMPGGTPSIPKIAAVLAVAPAMLQAEDARPVPGARRRSLAAHGRRRAGRFRYRAAHRVALPRQAGRRPGGEEHDQHVLLQPATRSSPAQSRPKDVPRWKPPKVGILGAGMMGGGIAYAQASRGVATRAEGRDAWRKPKPARPTARRSREPASTKAG